MNSREAIVTALSNGQPDYVPYTEMRVDNAVLRECGGKDYKIFDFVEDFGLDGVPVWPDYEKPGAGWAGWKNGSGKQERLVDQWGVLRARGEGEHYSDLGGSSAPVETLDDLLSLEIPDLKTSDFQPLIEAVNRFKGEKAIILRARDVWSRPRALLGYEHFLKSMYKDKEMVKKAIEISVEFNKQTAKFAADLGADVFWTGDDIADNRGLLISPELFRELFIPKLKELVQYCHELGLYYIKHTDGYIMDIIEDFIDLGIDCINPIEPYAGMDLPKIKAQFGDRITLMGNVDCRFTLPEGGTREIQTETIRALCEGEDGGGFILQSSNTIHQGIPFENYQVMIETWKKMRDYPLDCARYD